MKKILPIITILVLTSCSKLEDLNNNTKDFASVPGEAIFNGACRAFSNQMLTCNVSNNNTMLFAQHWAVTTYPEESQYDMVTRPIPGNHMNTMYRNVLMNLKDAKGVLELQKLNGIPQAQRDNQLAEIEIMSVFAWSNIVETFGSMPYTEALDYTKPTPKYDDALTIYKALIARLNTAIATLNTGIAVGGMGTYDNFYTGNVASTSKWIKMANTLKLRMGLMLSDVASETDLAKTTIEAAVPLAFNIAGETFSQTYLNAAPNTNPLYTELVNSNRDDFVPANTLVNKMNTLSDPRRAFYFTQYSGTYVGGVYGTTNTYGDYSHINPEIVGKFPVVAGDPISARSGLLMDYVEAEFLRAEAAARGYTIDGSAQTHYNNAIKASIKFWGGSDAQADTYLAQPTVIYDAPNWKNSIGTQAWIAYWFRGFTAWTSWRRLDYPRLVATSLHVTAVNGIPYRYIYPVSEQSLNGDNYTAAKNALGGIGDNAMNPLFWDVFQYNTITGL